MIWANDCLLGLKQYEKYLEITKPQQIFGTQTHNSNFRLNIQKKNGFNANPIDILLMAGGRNTEFITTNQVLYKHKVMEVFTSYSDKNGGWFRIFKKWNPDNKPYSHSLFGGSPLWDKPKLPFEILAFYTANMHMIKLLSKEAENKAREELGHRMVDQGTVLETEIFKKIELEFSNTTVIHHGWPERGGRQHFDIWLPDLHIAVDCHRKYEEGDKRKTEFAKKYGIDLLNVYETDNQVELIKRIYMRIKKRNELQFLSDLWSKHYIQYVCESIKIKFSDF